jgi:transcriptional regulator with XRE-family HTH domain
MTALQERRMNSGISRRWLASQLGVSKTTLWRYERGDVEAPKSVLFHAAHILRVPLDVLIPGTEADSSPTSTHS